MKKATDRRSAKDISYTLKQPYLCERRLLFCFLSFKISHTSRMSATMALATEAQVCFLDGFDPIDYFIDIDF